MKLLLKRIALKPTYTIGWLYIDGQKVCDTIEDAVRDLNKNGRFDNGEKKKCMPQPLSPTGHTTSR